MKITEDSGSESSQGVIQKRGNKEPHFQYGPPIPMLLSCYEPRAVDTIDKHSLIEEVKEHPALWTIGHPDYKDARKKDHIWNIIGAKFAVPGDDARKVWNQLRNQYCREVTRSASTTGRPSRWAYFQQLDFLSGVIRHRQYGSHPSACSSPQIATSNGFFSIEDGSVHDSSNSDDVVFCDSDKGQRSLTDTQPAHEGSFIPQAMPDYVQSPLQPPAVKKPRIGPEIKEEDIIVVSTSGSGQELTLDHTPTAHVNIPSRGASVVTVGGGPMPLINCQQPRPGYISQMAAIQGLANRENLLSEDDIFGSLLAAGLKTLPMNKKLELRVKMLHMLSAAQLTALNSEPAASVHGGRASFMTDTSTSPSEPSCGSNLQPPVSPASAQHNDEASLAVEVEHDDDEPHCEVQMSFS